MAQKTDTIIAPTGTKPLRSDSIHIREGQLYISEGKTYLINKDTLYLFDKNKGFTKLDSLYKIKDSLRKITGIAYSKRKVVHHKNDSMYRRTKTLFVSRDSLYRKNDSLYRKAQFLRSKQDSLYNRNKKLFTTVQYRKLDSLKSISWRKDSVRIKGNLIRLKSDLQRLKLDSARQNGNLLKRAISMEVDCDKDATITMRDMGRKVIIKTWDEKKIKIETVIFAEEGFDGKDINWEKDLKIFVDSKNNSLTISKGSTANASSGTVTISKTTTNAITASGGNETLAYTNPTTINGGEVAESRMYKLITKSQLTLYIPATVNINIEQRYNELEIADNLYSVKFDLMNSPLKMKNADKAVIKSRYATVKAGTIQSADIDLLNCKFTSADIGKLLISSKYSDITVSNVDHIEMKSVSDHYQISKARDISGNKSFGKLMISELGNSINLFGSSADVEIQLISANATSIKLDNRYADVKLPVQQLLNYSVQFDGNYSKVFTPFEKINTYATDSLRIPNPAFTKIAGDVKKEHTAFVVNCASCSVDFR